MYSSNTIRTVSLLSMCIIVSWILSMTNCLTKLASNGSFPGRELLILFFFGRGLLVLHFVVT